MALAAAGVWEVGESRGEGLQAGVAGLTALEALVDVGLLMVDEVDLMQAVAGAKVSMVGGGGGHVLDRK